MAQGLSLEAVPWGVGDGCAPSFGSCALEGCPTLFFFLQKRCECQVLQCALWSAVIVFQKSLVPCCFHPLLRSSGRGEALQHPFIWDVTYHVRSATFTSYVLELEECEQPEPPFLFPETALSKRRLKLEGICGGSCMVWFVLFFNPSSSRG